MPATLQVKRPSSAPVRQELVIRRFDAFGAYALFKSLPPMLRYPAKDRRTGQRLTPRELAISVGIEDKRVLDLVELKTQKNFAERFDIAEQTLGRWNRVLAANPDFNSIQEWARPLSNNVLLMLYMRLIQGKAQPGHFKLWFQVVNGWSDKKSQAENTRPLKGVEIVFVGQKV